MALPELSPSTAPAAEAAGRQRILDEAATLFVRQGFEATSLRHIASACGMQAGSLYYHFASKNDLLETVLARGMSVMVEAFQAAEIATTGADAHTRIGAHVRAHLAALFENGPYTAAHVMTFRTAPPEVHNAIVAHRDGYEAMWTKLLQGLIDSGEIDSATPVGLSRLTLFGSMNTTVEWFDLDRGNLDQLAEVITNQFLTGVTA
mgnify:CR=1 FL=1|jgi:AcrR family transcriptional regulator